jgi:hypothetical protein
VTASRESGSSWFDAIGRRWYDAENDLRLIAVMRRYFAVKDELTSLMSLLEEMRKATGEEVGEFYHVRSNSEHADQVIRTVALKRKMDHLMRLAESWTPGEIISLEAYAD